MPITSGSHRTNNISFDHPSAVGTFYPRVCLVVYENLTVIFVLALRDLDDHLVIGERHNETISSSVGQHNSGLVGDSLLFFLITLSLR